MGMRLIDADAIVFTHAIVRSIDDGHNWTELCVTKDEIDDMPSVETGRKTGKWIENKHMYYCCSECGHEAYWDADCIYQKLFDFCPNCGADMRDDDE